MKKIESQTINKTNAIGKFMGKFEGSRNCIDVLQNAIEFLCTVFSLERGEAVYVSEEQSARYHVIRNESGKATSLSSNFNSSSFVVPNWQNFSKVNVLFEIKDFKTLSHLSKQCRAFIDSQELANALTGNLSKTPSILIPLFASDDSPVGFVHVFQESKAKVGSLSMSSEIDELFLSFSKELFEIFLENMNSISELRISKAQVSDLATTNRALMQSVENFRNKQTKLLEESRKAGMNDVAVGVLHNIGNVLNSINVSASLIAGLAGKLKVQSLRKSLELLTSNTGSLDSFLSSDDIGKSLLDYLNTVTTDFSNKQTEIQKEANALINHIEHVKSIINIQQSNTSDSGLIEQCSFLNILEDATSVGIPSHLEEGIEVVFDFEAIPLGWTDRHKVMQIIVNLVSNARNALLACGRKRKVITVSIYRARQDCVRIIVKDNGIGIPMQNLHNVFAQGFSTRKDGHGIGLHTSANAVRELKGKLWCESAGPDQGASFFLELPLIIDLDSSSKNLGA